MVSNASGANGGGRDGSGGEGRAEVESPAAAVWARAAGLAVEVERVGRVEAKGVETVLGVVAGRLR